MRTHQYLDTLLESLRQKELTAKVRPIELYTPIIGTDIFFSTHKKSKVGQNIKVTPLSPEKADLKEIPKEQLKDWFEEVGGHDFHTPTGWYYHRSWLDFHKEGEQIEMPLFESAEWGPVLIAKVKQLPATKIDIWPDEMKKLIGKKIKVREKLGYTGSYYQEPNETDHRWWFAQDWLDFNVSDEGEQQELPLFESAEWGPVITAKVKKNLTLNTIAKYPVKIPQTGDILTQIISVAPGMVPFIGKEIKVRKYLPDGTYRMENADLKQYKWWFHKDWLDFHEEGEQIELPLFESSKKWGPVLTATVKPDPVILSGWDNGLKKLIGKKIKVRKDLYDTTSYRMEPGQGFQWWLEKDWLKFEDEQQELPLFESVGSRVNGKTYMVKVKTKIPNPYDIPNWVPEMDSLKGKTIKVIFNDPYYKYSYPGGSWILNKNWIVTDDKVGEEKGKRIVGKTYTVKVKKEILNPTISPHWVPEMDRLKGKTIRVIFDSPHYRYTINPGSGSWLLNKDWLEFPEEGEEGEEGEQLELPLFESKRK